MHLSLALLGQFQVTLSGQPVNAFASDKARALLAYLALERTRPHSRSALAALLWPDYSEESARTNLRQALHQLRDVIGDIKDTTTPFLLITRQTIQLNPAASFSLDVATFQTLLQDCANHHPPMAEGMAAASDMAHCLACRQRLRQAVNLYAGDFLQGFAVADSASFEEWRRITQERLHLQMVDLLCQLANAYEAEGDNEQARHYATRQLALEPWREEAHLQIMRTFARQGQRVAALAQYQSCRQVLAAELGVEPNVATTQLYEQIRTGTFSHQLTSVAATANIPAVTAATLPLPAPSLALNHNLPAQLTPFVGRVTELADLVARLQQPDLRLLTLVGPGGMGKTRLALEIARARLGHYPDGVFFIALAPLTSADALAPAIAAAIGLDLHGADPQKTLLHFLRSKQLLLILDNFEHLLDAVAFVADLMQAAPGLQIMTTSRTRLNLHGEHCYPVQPLAFDSSMPLAKVADTDAVRLFVQCAKRIHPEFGVNATNLPAVLRICQLVEGMPLGLEMAAAWSEWLSLAEIAREIEASSDFLTIDWSDTPARQRSMRAVFEWSWKLLDENEQQAFRLLSIFRDGFTRAAAAQITGAPLRTLVSLVNKSLLYVTYTQETDARYQVHELLRQFGAEQLDALPQERAAVEARHSAYYLTFLADRELRLARHEPRQAATEIQQELANVRQAWHHAIEQANCALLNKSAATLVRYYDFTGLIKECIQALERAVTKLEARGLPPSSGVESVQCHQLLLSKLLGMLAGAMVRHGKFDEGIALAQRAITLGKAFDNVEHEAYAQMVMGQGFYRKGQYKEARTCFVQTLQLVHAYPRPKDALSLLNDAEYTAHIWLGAIESEAGHFVMAKACFDQSIDLCRRLNNRRSEVHAHINLANLLRRMSDYPAARQIYEECLPIAHELGYHWGEGETLVELGDTVRMLGEYSLAHQLLLRAETQLVEFGYTLEQIYCYLSLARLHCYLGAYGQARQWLDRALQVPVLQDSAWLMLVALLTSATLAYLNADHEQVVNDATGAVQLGEQLSNPLLQGNGLLLLGHAQLALQQPAAAEQNYTQASAVYHQLGNVAAQIEARAGLALLAFTNGAPCQALAYIEEFLPRLQLENTIGLDEPFFVYLTCYRILAACQDDRATQILATGYYLLQHYVEHLEDDTLRHSFLEQVSVHAELYQICVQAGFGPLFA